MLKNIRRFMEKCQEHGIRSALRGVLRHFKLLNAIRFRELRLKIACDIATQIPASTNISHPVGIVIAHSVTIREETQINQNVTIGEKDGGYPKICEGATIFGAL